MLNADAKSFSLGSLNPRFQHDLQPTSHRNSQVGTILLVGFGVHTPSPALSLFPSAPPSCRVESRTWAAPPPIDLLAPPSPRPVSTLWWPFFSDYSPLRVLHMPPGRFPHTIRPACTDFTHADGIKASASNHMLRRMVRHVNVWCATVFPLEWTFQGYTTQKGSNMCTNDCCFPGYNLMRLEDEIIATITHAFFFFFFLALVPWSFGHLVPCLVPASCVVLFRARFEPIPTEYVTYFLGSFGILWV